MRYRQVQFTGTTVQELAEWLGRELLQLERAFREQDDMLLVEMFVAPTKPRDGLTVFADGTSWDPGSGRGVYTYYGSAWHKLG